MMLMMNCLTQFCGSQTTRGRGQSCLKWVEKEEKGDGFIFVPLQAMNS
jgi:hypothetical protein